MSATVVTGPGWTGQYDLVVNPNWTDTNISNGFAWSTCPLQEVVRKCDPLLNMICTGRTSIFGEYVSLSDPDDPSECNHFSLAHPVDFPVPVDGDYDHRTYATALHGFDDLISILSVGSSPIAPSHLREKFCRHATYQGVGAFPIEMQAPLVVEEGIAFHNDNGPMVLCKARSPNAPSYQGLSNPGNVWDPVDSSFFRFSLLSIVEEFQKLGIFYYGGGTEYWRISSEVLSLDSDPSELRFRTRTTLKVLFTTNPDLEYSWTLSYRFILPRGDVSRFWALNHTGRWWFIDVTDLCSLVISDISCNYSVDLQPFGLKDLSDRCFVTFRGVYPQALPSFGEVRFPSDSIDSKLRDFRAAIDRDWKDIVPAALFSTVSAVNAIEGGTTTDVLQTLAKLPEYKSMIPRISEAVKVLEELSSRKLTAATLKDICDLAASTILQSSFQWRPFLQLLMIELPKMLSAILTLQDERKVVAGRGSWSFQFQSPAFNRLSSRLVTRSKIVLDVSGKSLAASLLGLDALGVLPKPSNLWDLVPYSFVLNWVAGIGQSIKRAEYSALLVTIPGYFVHTYAVSSPFTQDELIAWSLSSSTVNPLSLRVYYRDISLYSPLPHDSRFGFGIPTSLPPLATIGALLYQILF